MKKLIGKRVTVTWTDTTNMAAWLTPDEVREFARDGAWICQNTGWVSHQDKHCIVVSARASGSGHLGLSERIPSACVTKIKVH